MLLFAQGGAGPWFTALGDIGLWGFLAIGALCAAATDITRRVLKHRERIAMIHAGMNPSDLTATSDD